MRKRSISPGVAVALAAGAVLGVADAHAHTFDLLYFVHRGDVLLSAGWRSTFGDPALQAGPAQVGLLALIGKLARLPGVSQGLALSVVLQTALAGALASVTGRVLADRPPRTRLAAQAGVVAVAAATQMLHRGYAEGHPAQVVTPVLWIAAGLLARRGRPGRAGVLVGLSACCETWGLLGLPVLLLASGARRRLALGAGLAAGVVALLYGPFVLFGQFRMLQYRWLVAPGSPADLFLAAGSPYTWWLRAIQGAAAVGVGAALALGLRRSAAAVWAVPLGIVVTRLSLEPTLNDWYLIAAETLALVAAADLGTGRLAAIRATLSAPRARTGFRARREPRAGGARPRSRRAPARESSSRTGAPGRAPAARRSGCRVPGT